ncbi:MAG: carbohydrate kinase [Synergistaceae bacterium]|jgi:fructokinase|nr:carbohydrate kinase [Synergistaceae bacterium]
MRTDVKFDIVSMGEMIVDFTQYGASENGYTLYEQNPGGGAANISACVARLDGRVAFLGKVGDDSIGVALKDAMLNEGVDISGLVFDSDLKTFLAFVHVDENNERSFSFYGHMPAHLALRPEELNLSILRDTKILAYGDKILAVPDAFETTMQAVRIAKNAGAKIAFDPNIRLSLWSSPASARETILAHLPYCDFVKLSTDELYFLTEQKNLRTGADRIMLPEISLVMITDGENGAYAFTKSGVVFHPAYSVDTIDTTGAGDAFWGGTILQIARQCKEDFSSFELEQMLSFSCACGALATTRHGAVPAMPTTDMVQRLQNQQK